jgi:hypothetical protein
MISGVISSPKPFGLTTSLIESMSYLRSISTIAEFPVADA